MWSLYQKQKNRRDAYKTYSRNCVIVKVSRTSGKILGRTVIKAVSQNDIELPFFQCPSKFKKKRTKRKKKKKRKIFA